MNAPLWTSADIAAATGGAASASFSVTGVAFDSREVGAGDLFIALTGEITDGHRFIDGAFAQGAGGAIVSTPCAHPHVLVADTMAALNALGRAARARTSAKIFGVTGSVGKTGTKEALANALARANRGAVHRSVKSYNNQTGVPLSLARMPVDTAYAVFEMGMNHAGELAELTQLVRPHVALITTVAAAHIEFFTSVEAIADAKGEIFQGLERGGTAIIPLDNPHAARLINHAKPYAHHTLTFGRGEGADVRATEAMATPSGTMLTVALPEAELCFTLSQAGDHWVSNALAVIAAVNAVGGDLAAAGLALSDMEGLAGRGAQHKIKLARFAENRDQGGSVTVPEWGLSLVGKGDSPQGTVPALDPDLPQSGQDLGDALLIDESYNANPTSMAATLAVLGATDAVRRIAVLGAMRELGETSDAHHAGLADPIIAASVDFALLVGSGIEPLAKALKGKVDTVHVPNAAAALKIVRTMVQPGDVILIKGSNAIGLAHIVASLTGGQS